MSVQFFLDVPIFVSALFAPTVKVFLLILHEAVFLGFLNGFKEFFALPCLLYSLDDTIMVEENSIFVIFLLVSEIYVFQVFGCF